jgi:hypothetical protein
VRSLRALPLPQRVFYLLDAIAVNGVMQSQQAKYFMIRYRLLCAPFYASQI